jgi:GNAT superfamily N-acetyltransferase
MTTVGEAPALAYRPVRPDELATCADIWRAGINDYIRRLNQPDVPDEVQPLIRLYAHMQATDPERFVVATFPTGSGDGEERVVAFAAATLRERVWFLSMCFVLPEHQGAGVGRALVERVRPPDDPATRRGTATDSAQPISNALYATLGIVPRLPLLNLIGDLHGTDAFGPLPSGVTPLSFEALEADDGHEDLADTIDALDREVLGAAHPVDHRWLRQESRRGWLYRGPDGGVLGYGYASEAGRVGPVAVRDEALLAPVVGHLGAAVRPRGGYALWLPGSADRTIVAALRAGFRLEPFPLLLCWDRPFADFARYLPISPGLL